MDMTTAIRRITLSIGATQVEGCGFLRLTRNHAKIGATYGFAGTEPDMVY
jgi:hypothetical protein